MSNCIIFVFMAWLRRGGYVVVRQSPRGYWPHFLWSADLIVFEEYTPVKPKLNLLIPPPLYHGMVKVTSAHEQNINNVKRGPGQLLPTVGCDGSEGYAEAGNASSTACTP